MSLRSPPKYKPFFAGSTSPELTTVVTNTRLLQTMGEDQPRPGTSTRHATFSLVLQCSGRFGLSATPSAPGPRNCGQFATESPAAIEWPKRLAVKTARKKGHDPTRFIP